MRLPNVVLLLVALYALGLGGALFSGFLPPLGKAAVLAIGVLLAGLVYRETMYEPLVATRSESRERILEFILDRLVDDYVRENLEHNNVDSETYNLRANVMIVDRKIVTSLHREVLEKLTTQAKNYIGFVSSIRRLKILAHTMGHCPSGLELENPDYPEAELELYWYEPQGCCGYVLSENQPDFFDSEERYETTLNTMEHQRELTRYIQSVLSIPVYHPNDATQKEPIAVLNLDSESNVDKTNFDESHMQNLVSDYLEPIGTLLPRRL